MLSFPLERLFFQMNGSILLSSEKGGENYEKISTCCSCRFDALFRLLYLGFRWGGELFTK